jgi:hypothetical protein
MMIRIPVYEIDVFDPSKSVEDDIIIAFTVKDGHIHVYCAENLDDVTISPNTAHEISQAFDKAHFIAQEQRDKYDERGQ